MNQVKDFFEGEGPTLIDGEFNCSGCVFHNPTPKQKDGVAYQISFCTFDRLMRNRLSDKYIGRETTTPDWCPMLENLD